MLSLFGGMAMVPIAGVILALAWGQELIDPPSSGNPPEAPLRTVSLLPEARPVPIPAPAPGDDQPAAVPEAPEPDGNPGDPGEDRSMLIRVVGPGGEPMAGVDVQRSVWTTVPVEDRNKHFTTDDRGEARIDVPHGLRILRLWVRAEGHVSLYTGWEEPENPEKTVPEEFSFQLAKGTVVGGVVRNEDGEPIEGATVDVKYESGGERSGRVRPSDWLTEDAGAPITDAEGRWTIDNVPAGDDVEVRVKLRHPDYIDDSYWGWLQEEQSVTMAALRDRSATIIMHRGVSTSGTVTDPDGKPVAGAVVVWGDDPYFEIDSQEVRTDEAGAYRLASLPPGPLTVTVMAPGWKPELREIELEPGMNPVDFRLEPGKVLRIGFVDPSGKPIPGVYVGIADWRGGKSLYNEDHPNVLDTKIPRLADEDGLFEWSWAPDDAVTYRFGKQGFAGKDEVELVADGTEQTVTLSPELRISGTVTDATTGRLIDRVTAMPVIEFRPGFLHVNRRGVTTFAGGRYAIDFDRPDIAHRVRIEAEGYRSAMSDAFRVGDPDPTFDFRLEPTPPASGRVVAREGTPVEGARVFLVSESQGLDYSDLEIHEDYATRQSDTVPAVTDARGEFAFPAQFETSTVLVIHDRGYAEASFGPDEQPGDSVLQDWVRIDGRLLQKGNRSPRPGSPSRRSARPSPGPLDSRGDSR